MRGRSDTNRLQDESEIVRDDADPVPLGEYTERGRDEGTMTVSLGRDKIHPRRAAIGGPVGLDGSFYLGHLKINERRVIIAAGVVFCQDLAGFGMLADRNEVSRGLGDEEAARQENDRDGDLQNRGNTPRPVVSIVARAEGLGRSTIST